MIIHNTRIYLIIQFTALLLANAVPLAAQWSTDPTENLQVSSWGILPEACTDGNGGVFIMWENPSTFRQVILQRVDRHGYVQWEWPILIEGLEDEQRVGSIIEDGYGNAFLTFSDCDLVDSLEFIFDCKVRVQKVDSLGNILWGDTGILTGSDTTEYYGGLLAPDGEGGMYATWLENVEGSSNNDAISLQHFSGDGMKLLGEEGIRIREHSPNVNYLKMVGDELGGVILNWRDIHLPTDTWYTYFERIDSVGITVWKDSLNANYLFVQEIVSDGIGGVIASAKNDSLYPYVHLNGFYWNVNGDRIWGENGITIADSITYDSYTMDMDYRSDSVTIIYWIEVIDYQEYEQSYVQMISFDGQVLFDNKGIMPSTVEVTQRTAMEMTLSDSNKSIYLFIDNRPESGLYAQKLSESGQILWDSSDVLLSSRSFETHIVSDKQEGLIAVWDEWHPTYGIYAQQISRNGNLGEVLPPVNTPTLEQLPGGILLSQNYPNPFNRETIISYQLPKQVEVSLVILNLLGETVVVLVDEKQDAGEYTVSFNGQGLASGIYFYQLKCDGPQQTRKFVYLR